MLKIEVRMKEMQVQASTINYSFPKFLLPPSANHRKQKWSMVGAHFGKIRMVSCVLGVRQHLAPWCPVP